MTNLTHVAALACTSMIIYRMAKFKSPESPSTQARQARASSETLNYETLAPQARQASPSGEI